VFIRSIWYVINKCSDYGSDEKIIAFSEMEEVLRCFAW